MSDNSFHYFTRLPLELRRLIWEHCLPYRIAELDIPAFLLDGEESRQACLPEHTKHQNAQLPVIAFVNSESRQVALEMGRWERGYETTSQQLIWVQPRRDVLHLNWTRMSYDVLAPLIELDSPIGWFSVQAEGLGMQPSIVAEIIYYFDLKGLLEGADGADSADDDEPFSASWSRRHDGMYDPLSLQEVSDIAALEEFHRCYDVAIAAVSLHITREAALKSGLFGLLGDAPVQMVDVGDEARLRQFQALFSEHALEKESAVQTLFDLLTSTRFHAAVETWKRQAEWIILASLWDYARKENGILKTDPGSAWVPYLSGPEYQINLHRCSPNENHPWVKETRQSMPKLRPWIMVRHCANECYRKPPPKSYW